MKNRPKLILGTVIIISSLALFFTLSQLINRQNTKSTFAIDYEENKFKLTFLIRESDKDNFNSFLKNLYLDSYSPEDPIFLELDSTSSARFAFQTPIKLILEPESKELNFTGTISQRFFNHTPEVTQAEIPKSSELVIFSADLIDFFLSRLNLANDTSAPLRHQLNPMPGNYLVTFNSAKNFALYFKSDASLSNLEGIEPQADPQNQNTNGTSTPVYRIVSKSEDSQQAELTPVLFEDRGFKIFASSMETANIILDSEENFSNPDGGNEFDISIYFEPKSDFNADRFLSFLTQGGIYNLSARDKLANAISKIDTFSFTLKRTAFSGLIKLK